MPPKLLFIDWDKTLSDSRFWQHWEPARYQIAARALFADATGLPYRELMEELQYSCEHMAFIRE